MVAARETGKRSKNGAAKSAVLSCRGVRKNVDGHVLVDDVWFNVHAGESYGLIGPAGAGKTTILLAACGLLDPDDPATVLLRGKRIDRLDTRTHREWVGYVARSAVLLPSATVAENLRFWARFLRVPAASRAERIAEVTALTGLEEFGTVPVDHSPAGALCELSVAVALLYRPHLLVLDEPLRGMAPAEVDRLAATLTRVRDRGTAVLYASRSAGEVRSLCDRVGVLDRGRLVAEGTPDAMVLSAA